MQRPIYLPIARAFFVFFVLVFPSLGWPVDDGVLKRGLGRETTVTLVVLHTNDTHGQILSFTLPLAKARDGATSNSAESVAALVRKIRVENGRRTLLLDAGDVLSRGGSAIAADGGLGAFEIMNAMGYDAMVPGNGDYYLGVENLLHLRGRAKFSVVEANIFDRESGKLLFDPYVIKEVGGVRVGIIGLGFIHEDNPSCRGLVMKNYAEEARKYAPLLRKKCDLVIALTHIGHYEDVLLASQVPDIDLVVGGHSHTILPKPVEVKRTGGASAWVAQAGSMGAYLGRLNVKLNNHSGRYRVARVEGELIPFGGGAGAGAKPAVSLDVLKQRLEKELKAGVKGALSSPGR